MTGLLKADRQQKGHRVRPVALIMSALIIALAAASSAKTGSAAAGNNLVDPIVTASLEPVSVPHELRIELTAPGSESVRLAARLHEAGNYITRPIKWTVKRQEFGASLDGSVVFKEVAPETDTPLEPGKYVVEASYGYHKVSQEVIVQTGQRIGITLILNVGGIRALSSIKNTFLPTSIDAFHAVYAVSGPLKGRRIVDRAGQGHVMRLGAGTYRVESRFTPGNTVADGKVVVKPGILSSMEMDHQAGLAKIIVGQDKSDAVAWEIRSLATSWSRNQTSPVTSMVLAPGKYEITAVINGSVVTEKFTIRAGDTRHVKLGLK